MSFTTRHIDAPQVLYTPTANFIVNNNNNNNDNNDQEDKDLENHDNNNNNNNTTSTKKILAASSFQDMVGVLKQVNFLAYHASSIFTSLGNRVEETGGKLSSISNRLIKLEENVMQLEEKRNNIGGNNIQERISNTYMESNKSSTLRDENQSFQNFFTVNTRDKALNTLYDECMPPPPLETMDKFLPKNNEKRSCLLKYSNPQYFMEQWIKNEIEKLEKYRLEKAEHRRQHRNNLNNNSSTRKSNPFDTDQPLDFGDGSNKNGMKYNTHKFSPRTAARKSALKLDKDKERYSATLKNLDTATRNLNVMNDVDNNIISNQSSGIINESNNVVSSPPQPTSSQTIQPTAAVTQMPTNNNTVNINTANIPTNNNANNVNNKMVKRQSSIPIPPPLPMPGQPIGNQKQPLPLPIPPPLPMPAAANSNNNNIKTGGVMAKPMPSATPGLASFLDDVKKFRKDKLKSASDAVANDNDDTSANATSTSRRGSTTSDDLKAQPGSLLDAIRKRAMTVDETNRSRTVSIDDIIASKKKKRAQSYKETGVAAILAHRIAMMGGDLSDNDEEDGSSDDDWE